MKKIGVLTSGGDSPGMNAAVRAVVKTANHFGMSVVGIKRGYNGVLHTENEHDIHRIDFELDMVLDISSKAGTYLRTARCKEFYDPKYREMAADIIKNTCHLDGLVVIGGDGSFHGAQFLSHLGVPCIGIPGTIDNDLAYTDSTLGHDTAVNVCLQAIRSIRATSRSHDRFGVVEVMGRNCGDIALKAAIAANAEMCVVPEAPWSVEELSERLKTLVARGNTRATIVVAEGAYESMKPFDVYGYLKPLGKRVFEGEPMTAEHLATILTHMSGQEGRATVLGYIQRGAKPTAQDSHLAFESGYMAVKLLLENEKNKVIGIDKGVVFHMDIDEALAVKKDFNYELLNLVNTL